MMREFCIRAVIFLIFQYELWRRFEVLMGFRAQAVFLVFILRSVAQVSDASDPFLWNLSCCAS